MVLKAEKIELARPINLLEEQEAQLAYEKETDKITLGQATSAAFAEDNTMSYIYNGLEEHKPDENFLLDEESYKEFTKDIPIEYHDFLEDAVSKPHAEKLRGRVLESLKNEKTLAGYGWGAIPLRLTAAILDPGAIAATVLTEGVAAPFIWGGKLTRLSRAFRGLATGGVSSAGVEAYLVSQNAVKDPYDILYAAAGGMFLGGVVGGVFGKSSDDALQSSVKKIMESAKKGQEFEIKKSMINQGIAKESDFIGPQPRGKAEDPTIKATTKETPVPKEAPVERMTVYDSEGQPRNVEKVSVDEAGAVTVKDIDGTEKVVDQSDVLSKSVYDEDYKIEMTIGSDARGDTVPDASMTFAELKQTSRDGKYIENLKQSREITELEITLQKEGKVVKEGIFRKEKKVVNQGKLTRLSATLKAIDLELRRASGKAVVRPKDPEIPKVSEPVQFVPKEDLSVGAAVNPEFLPINPGYIKSSSAEAVEAADDTPISWWNNMRIDMVGRLLNSKLGLSRLWGGRYGENGLDGGGASADIYKTIITKRVSDKYYNVFNKSFDEWAKSNNIGYRKKTFGDTRASFSKQVADEIEIPGSSLDQNIINAANGQRVVFKELLQELKRAGVKGFEDIPEDLTYFTHLWDGAKFTSIRAKHGDKFTEDLLSGSLQRANMNLTKELADAIGKGMAKNVDARNLGVDAGMARIFSTSNKDVLRDILVEEDILSEIDADKLIKLLDFKPDSVPSRAKSRLKFDVNYSMKNRGEVISVKDLMNRDAEQVFNVYLNQMAGRIGFARVGIKSDADHEKLMKQILDEAGNKFGSKKLGQADVDKFDVMYDLILGRPPKTIQNPGSKANRMARLLMDYNFLRAMNQVGFAQVAELGNAVSIDGVRGIIRVIPEFARLIKRAKNGELLDAVGRDLEAWCGIGVDRRIRQQSNRYDSHDIHVSEGSDWIDKATDFLQPLKRMTADISGMAPITVALERGAAKIAVQSLTDIAYGVKRINFKKLGNSTIEQDIAARMNSLGLDEDMAQRVFDQIRNVSITTPSTFFKGRKIRNTNLDNWTDPGARDAFTVAITRWARQAIQQNDVGNLNIHMTSTMGKMLTQFRGFMIVSYTKQFLHNIKRNDFAAYSSMMYSSIFAGAAYTLQTHAKSILRDDKSEFLEERLSVEEIGKAAFQRSSWASLLPGIVDTATYFHQDEPIFAYGRTTGLASNLFTGNPTIDLVDKLGKAGSGFSRSILNADEYQFSQSHGRAAKSIIPFQNALVITNVMNKMFEDLPESAKVD